MESRMVACVGNSTSGRRIGRSIPESSAIAEIERMRDSGMQGMRNIVEVSRRR
jgi:hypothetical protein